MNKFTPNGCGAKGSIFKPPYAIFFKASCDIHDYNYEKGKTELDRLRSDLGLLKYMKLDLLRLSKWKQPYYYIWVYIYYYAVRIFGKKYFNYNE